jgi:acetylornithine/succinyldiaminopimelate/putrescine aminotransferase/3-oxoacyl-(acyl-carrier-protein) synthase/predicted amino acid dehydrogenase
MNAGQNASRSVLDGLSTTQLKLLIVELQRKFAATVAEGRQESKGAGAIAITGMAGRYPGTDGTLAGFWRMMEAGRGNAAQWPSDGRPFMAKSPDRPSSAAAFCDGLAAFDAEAFGIPVGEARMTDPQLRVALETAWTALEDAGLGGAGAIERTGVFFAVATNDFADLVTAADIEPGGYFALGNSHGLFAGRLSRVLRLTGPSLAVNSACSSALVAANEAIRALRQGECDAALVGGVNAILSDKINRDLAALDIVSATARCRPFDAAADGYLRGEGCGFVVLRLAEAARRDGHRVIAEIRGLAMNHDGAGNVLTPSRKAQAAAMKAALREAGANAADVVHVEAGSIGAPLADAAEGAALAEAYGGRRDAPLEIGTIKPLIGHLEAAAGVAALTRAALMVSRGQLLPHPDIDRPNPHMEWREAGLAPARAAKPLPEGALVAVNAASLSGANVHLLLARPGVAPATQPAPSGARPLLLSARSADGLSQLASELAARLRTAPESLADLAHTFLAGRSPLPWRAGLVATDAETALAALENLAGAHAPTAAADMQLHFADAPPELPAIASPFREAALSDWAAVRGAPGDAEARALAALLAAGALLRRAGVRCAAAGGSGIGLLAAAEFVGLIDAAGAMALLAARQAGRSEVPGLTLTAPRLPLAGGKPADIAELLARCRAVPPEQPAETGLCISIAGAGWTADTGEAGFARLVATLFSANAALDLGALAKLFGGRLVEAPLPRFERREHWPAPLLERWGPESVIVASAPEPAAPSAPLTPEAARALLGLILEEEAGVSVENTAPSLIDAGVSSVEIMRVVARIEREMGFSPDLDAFLAEPNLDGLVRQYVSRIASPETSPLAAGRSGRGRDRGGMDLSAEALLAELGARGVTLVAEAGQLRFRGPKGAVDGPLGEAIRAAKPQLLELLAAAPAEPAPVAPSRPSKRFSVSGNRPLHSPLVDPDWRPDHPFLKWVERDKGFLLSQLMIAKEFARAQGSHLWTAEGQKILDCLSQYGSLPFGHNPPAIWDALERLRASGLPAFTANALSPTGGALAERLIGLWPEAEFDGVVFVNSGAEAIEAALKLARAATGRAASLSAKAAFHGLTLGALSVGGSDAYRDGFAVPADPRDRIPYGDVAALEAAFARSPDRYAALLLEPIQGEAGIIDPPPGYLTSARELCDRHGALLVMDEVQSGLGRTGRLFAAQEEGVVGDIVTLAKALGGGLMPIGAVLYRKSARSEAFGLRHSSTFAGGALATTAGIASLDLLTQDDGALLAHVRRTGDALRARLEAIKTRHPELVSGLSGRGLMQGLRLDLSRLWEKPGLIGLMHEQQLIIHLVVSHLLNVGGVRLAPSFSSGNVLRIQPPLTVTEDELEPLYSALEATLSALEAGDSAALLSHMIGACESSSLPRASAAARRPPPEPRPSQAGETRFAFIVHPLEAEDFARLDPTLAGLPPGRLESLVRKLSGYIDPLPVEELEVRGADGARARGELILVPHTPEALMEMSAAKAIEEIGLAVDLAAERGAKVVGLGGFSSIATQGGMGLVKPGRPSLTSGNGYTAIAACRTVARAMATAGRGPAETHVVVVGAAGMIGRAAATMISETAGRLTLLGNPNRREKRRERGLAVAAEIIAAIGDLAGKRSPPRGSLAAELARMGAQTPDAAVALLEAEGLLVIGEELEAIAAGDAIIVATNSTERFIRAQHLKRDALLCDVSRPFNVHAEVPRLRPDVSLIEGGLIRPARAVSGGELVGPTPGIVFACAAETMLWALEGAWDQVHPQACMELDALLALDSIGRRHGFDVA